MYEYRRGGSVFGAFLLGGLVGAVLGLLFAPRSGRETRDMIAERAEDYWGEGVEMYQSGRDRVAVTAEQARDRIDEARDRLKEQVAKSAEVAKGKVEAVAPVAKDAVDRAAVAAKTGVDTASGKAAGTLDYVTQKAKTPVVEVPAEGTPVDVEAAPEA